MTSRKTMKAMVLRRIGDAASHPLHLDRVPVPSPGAGDVLVRVSVCGVCHTELDEIEGRLPPPRLPVVLGHQVVGRVAALGSGVTSPAPGERVGVAWIFSACGACSHCRSGAENLCAQFVATGRDVDGGYAEYMVADHRFTHAIPDVFSDAQAAPLLCAGAIGYRSLSLSGIADGGRLGLTGFGASGHLVLKMARHRYPNARFFVFARSHAEREFAMELGAEWAGSAGDTPGLLLDAIIDTTPAWAPVLSALERLTPGGRLVINAIRKEDADRSALVGLDYPRHLWMEKEIKSVANVTRDDVKGFLALAAEIPIVPDVQEFALQDANRALAEIKNSRIRGAKVLVVG
jgi:propanol-preferring alcohol dehydrogenase